MEIEIIKDWPYSVRCHHCLVLLKHTPFIVWDYNDSVICKQCTEKLIKELQEKVGEM